MSNNIVIASMFDMLERQQAAVIAEQQRAWIRALSLPHVIQSACATRVGTTPHDVVFETPASRLLRYRRETPASHAEPLVICYALINRHYILDLQTDKSIVRHYLAQGFDVYVIDWKTPSAADHGRTLEDYVCRFLAEVIGFVLRTHPAGGVHLLGYCMGGTLSTLFAALRPDVIRTLTLLAAPIDFSDRESLLNRWADRRYFDVDTFIDTHGNCPAAFLQACFLLMKPMQAIEKSISLYEQMDDPQFVTGYFAMERWINDNIPVAGETFREFVKKLYQRNELVRGGLRLGDREVDLSRITCPLLLLTARKDHLVAPSSTEGIRAHVRSRDIAAMTIEAGHVGLVVSGKAQKTLWPAATRWLAERSTPAASGDGSVPSRGEQRPQ